MLYLLLLKQKARKNSGVVFISSLRRISCCCKIFQKSGQFNSHALYRDKTKKKQASAACMVFVHFIVLSPIVRANQTVMNANQTARFFVLLFFRMLLNFVVLFLLRWGGVHLPFFFGIWKSGCRTGSSRADTADAARLECKPLVLLIYTQSRSLGVWKVFAYRRKILVQAACISPKAWKEKGSLSAKHPDGPYDRQIDRPYNRPYDRQTGDSSLLPEVISFHVTSNGMWERLIALLRKRPKWPLEWKS